MWPTPADLWSLDPQTTHLNHGSFGAVPVPVQRDQAGWRAAMEANPTRHFWRDLPERMGAVRLRAAEFVRGDPGRLALMANVTTAIAAVLQSVALHKGDEVVLSDDAYPGVRAAVDEACRRSGATVVVARMSAPALSAEGYAASVLEAVSSRTRLAVIDHVTSPSAIEVDVQELTRHLHGRGVAVAVDGAHAPGAIPLDVEAIGADYYAGSFHKWCCAPRGAAFLVFRERARAPAAAIVGSRAAEGFPSGVEWWGTADYSPLLAVPAALDFLGELGWETVRSGNAELVHRGAALLAERLGVAPPSASRLPMAVVPLPPAQQGIDVWTQRLRLLEDGVEVAVTDPRGVASLRVSANVYNSIEDFERLAAVVSAA